MLFVPTHETTFRILAIDPGTDTLGTAVLDVDLTCGRVSLVAAQTFSGASGAAYYPDVGDTHGNRSAKLYSHEQNLGALFRHFQPHNVTCEAPYMGRFPQAFEALVECRSSIRRALYNYDPTMPLEMVDPPTAKLAVGTVLKRGMDKGAVRAAILQLSNLYNATGRSVAVMDEHTIDAIAVGYFKANQVLRFLGGM